MSHCNTVYKPIPIPTAMKILQAKAALEMEWTKLQKQPAWVESKVTSEAEVMRRAKLKGKTAVSQHSWNVCVIPRTGEKVPKVHKTSGIER